ncbi:hypothetical protein V6N13_133487 [Hibiscus sabdariffa]|uniref:Uncharacterized protein n=1 Tax=Hibiscus sabdariffa TaxID=183260 RepID=A0ABR2CJ17_9ROSI
MPSPSLATVAFLKDASLNKSYDGYKNSEQKLLLHIFTDDLAHLDLVLPVWLFHLLEASFTDSCSNIGAKI